MDSVTQIAGLWTLFALTHIGLSSLRVRARLVSVLGDGPFLGLYSLVALAIFIPLVWIYMDHRHEGPLLWALSISPALLWALYIVMGVAWVLVVAGGAQPSPASLGASGPGRVHGVSRLTRHPVFMGVGIFGALHLVPLGIASDVAFFAGFPIFALLGCYHQDRRKLASGDEAFRDYYQKTPFLPFAGRETWSGLRELSPIIYGGGIALTIGLRLLHGPMFR